jgi:hypothetical protein
MYTLALVVVAFALGQTPQTQAAAISKAKNAVVQDLDKTLPRVAFEAWLRGLVGAQAVMKWEVNDCGEQTGSPADRGRDIPLCAEVMVDLTGNRKLSLSLLVGSMQRGLAAGPLTFASGVVIGSDPKQMTWIKTLGEAPKLVGNQ